MKKFNVGVVLFLLLSSFFVNAGDVVVESKDDGGYGIDPQEALTSISVLSTQSKSRDGGSTSVSSANIPSHIQDSSLNYLGDFVFDLPLMDLPGRNGVSYSVSLKYNSDVYNVSNSQNRDNQAPWVGTGFNLEAGAIKRDFGCEDYEDDDDCFIDESDDTFYLDLPGVSSSKLLDKGSGNEYVSKRGGYEKVERFNVGQPNEYWVVTDINGIKYTFDEKRVTYAYEAIFLTVAPPVTTMACDVDTWNTVSDPNYNPNWGVPDAPTVDDTDCRYSFRPTTGLEINELIYQWDLGKIEDPNGNEITFEYERHEEDIDVKRLDLVGVQYGCYDNEEWYSDLDSSAPNAPFEGACDGAILDGKAKEDGFCYNASIIPIQRFKGNCRYNQPYPSYGTVGTYPPIWNYQCEDVDMCDGYHRCMGYCWSSDWGYDTNDPCVDSYDCSGDYNICKGNCCEYFVENGLVSDPLYNCKDFYVSPNVDWSCTDALTTSCDRDNKPHAPSWWATPSGWSINDLYGYAWWEVDTTQYDWWGDWCWASTHPDGNFKSGDCVGEFPSCEDDLDGIVVGDTNTGGYPSRCLYGDIVTIPGPGFDYFENRWYQYCCVPVSDEPVISGPDLTQDLCDEDSFVNELGIDLSKYPMYIESFDKISLDDGLACNGYYAGFFYWGGNYGCCLRTASQSMLPPDSTHRWGNCLANFPYHPNKDNQRASYHGSPQYNTVDDPSINAAYLKSIKDSAGNEIKFILGPAGNRGDYITREANELTAPYLGEGSEETLIFNASNHSNAEKKYLDRIESYSFNGDLVEKVEFTYDYSSGNSNTKKLRLRDIQTFSGDGTKSLPPTKFNYYTTGHKNAIQSIEYSSGSILSLEYQPKTYGYEWDGSSISSVSTDSRGYRLYRKTINDGFGNTYQETYSTYTGGVLDTENPNNHHVSYNLITVAKDGFGRVETRYYNDLESCAGCPSYSGNNGHELDGSVYRVTSMDTGGNTFSVVNNNFEAVKTFDGDEDSYVPRLMSTSSTKDDIDSYVEYTYNDDNGLVETVDTFGGENNEILRQETLYAAYDDPFGDQGDMQAYFSNHHILSVPSQNKVIKRVHGSPGFNDLRHTAYKYACWDDTNGYSMGNDPACGSGSKVLLNETYIWENDTNQNAVAELSLDDYIITSVKRYSVYGQPLELEDPKGYTTKVFYGSESNPCSDQLSYSQSTLSTCQEDQVGNQVKTYYDGSGKTRAVKNANGLFINYDYDKLNRGYATSSVSYNRNLVRNPGLEIGEGTHDSGTNNEIDFWIDNSANIRRYSNFDGDEDKVHTGKWSVEFSGTGTKVLRQTVDNDAGDHWLSAWIYRDGCSGYLDLYKHPYDGPSLSTSTTGRWVFVKREYNDGVPADVQVRMVVGNCGSGEIYFDDISLSKEEPFPEAPFYLANVNEYNYGLDNCPSGLVEGDDECMNWIQTIGNIDKSKASISRTYSDGFTRPIQTKVLSDDGVIVSDTEYHPVKGLVDTTTEAYSDGVPLLKEAIIKMGFLGTNMNEELLKYKEDGGKSSGSGDPAKLIYYDDPSGRVWKTFPYSSYSSGDENYDCNDTSVDCTQFEYSGGDFVDDTLCLNNNFTCVKKIDAEGKSIQTRYDRLGNVVEVINPYGSRLYYIHDEMGQVVDIYDEHPTANSGKGRRVVHNVYDELGRLTEKVDLNSGKMAYFYDENGNILTVISGVETSDEKAKTFVYDDLDRVTEECYDGNKDGDCNDNGIDKTLLKNYYDSYDGTRQGVSCKEGGSSYGYLCKIEEFVSGEGTSINYWYDMKGRVKIISENMFGQSYSTNYDYDYSGNVKSITMPNGNSIEYSYNKLNEIDEVFINGDAVGVEFSYLGEGLLDQIVYPNGVTQSFTYTDKNQIETLSVAESNTYLDELYQYKPSGNLKNLTNVSSGHSSWFAYDKLYRLERFGNTGLTRDYYGLGFGYPRYKFSETGNRANITRTSGDGAGIIPAKMSYAYEEESPWLSEDSDWLTETYVTDTGETVCEYSYDNLGNLKTKDCGARVTQYSYDLNNRLSRINIAGGKSIQFKYDALGRRISKRMSTVRVGMNGLVTTSGINTIYIYGASDNPIIIKETRFSNTDYPEIQEAIIEMR